MEEFKGFKIVNDGAYGFKLIKPLGKGSVPKGLRGMYTNGGEAKKAIDQYLATKKVTQNGKTE